MELLKPPLHFDWDGGNRDKNFLKHRVTNAECEEVFFDPHKRLVGSQWHAGGAGRETRYLLVGRTKAERALFVVFTIRRARVRVISARDLNKRERGLLP